MDEQNFKFNYVFQGQDCTLSTGVYKITIQNHVYIGSAAISFRKCREAHLGKRLSEEAIAKRTAKQVKTIYQYDLDGNLIKEWDSVKQAGEALGINRPSISNCLKGRYKSAGGFIWRYSVEEVSPVKKTKSIEQYDLDGNLIKVWDSINSIENGTDYKRKTIYACANGQNSTAYGYVWKYCR